MQTQIHTDMLTWLNTPYKSSHLKGLNLKNIWYNDDNVHHFLYKITQNSIEMQRWISLIGYCNIYSIATWLELMHEWQQYKGQDRDIFTCFHSD